MKTYIRLTIEDREQIDLLINQVNLIDKWLKLLIDHTPQLQESQRISGHRS